MVGSLIFARRFLIGLVFLASLAACAAVHRSPATVASIIADGEATRKVQRATIDNIVERLAGRAAARSDRTVDLLLLSGGGQHGAYGIGFLRGWRSRTVISVQVTGSDLPARM